MQSCVLRYDLARDTRETSTFVTKVGNGGVLLLKNIQRIRYTMVLISFSGWTWNLNSKDTDHGYFDLCLAWITEDPRQLKLVMVCIMSLASVK